MIHGAEDTIVPPESVTKLVNKINSQKTVTITEKVIDDANHFFSSQLDEISGLVGSYMDENGAGRAAEDLLQD